MYYNCKEYPTDQCVLPFIETGDEKLQLFSKIEEKI